MNSEPSTVEGRGTGAERLADIALGWLPFLVAFVSIPLAVYLPNQIEFDWRSSILWPFAGAAGFWLLAVGTLWWAEARRRVLVVRGLFFVGLFVLLSDVLAPLAWGILDGESAIEEPWRLTAIEAGLGVLLILGAVKLPHRLVRTVGVPLVAVVTVAQGVSLAAGLEARPEAETDRRDNRAGEATGREALPNVYQVVFDGFGSRKLLDTVEELELAEAFDGFTLFERNLGNYQLTDAALPSLMTGTFFGWARDRELDAGDGLGSKAPAPTAAESSMAAWQRASRSSGLRRRLQDAGYEVSVYAPDETRYWMYEGADHVRTSRELTRSEFRGVDFFRLAQVVTVRLSPNILRQETFERTDDLFWRIVSRMNGITYPGSYIAYEFYKRLSLPLAEVFLAEEAERPGRDQYVYLHLMLPHPPYSWTADCEFGSSNYERQARCAVQLMARLLEELERLGRLDDSLVLFHSDHGFHNFLAGEPALEHQLPDEVVRAVDDWIEYTDVAGFKRRMHSLLMVKPPRTTGQLRVSRAPTQLADIPATVFTVLGIGGDGGHGRSVFEIGEDEVREIHHFFASHRPNVPLQHVSYSWGEGWRVYPAIAKEGG